MENVLLFFGGKSLEHDISVVTASQILNRTRIEDIKLVPIYISRDNKYYFYDSERFNLTEFSKSKFSASNKKFKEVTFVSNEPNIVFLKTKFGIKELLRAECAIIACHGGEGENGILEAKLKSFGFACSSGNELALAISMNKFIFKQVMRGLKVPTVSGFKISESEYKKDKTYYMNRLKFMKFPIIVKSCSGGSSIGVFVVKKREDFEKTLFDAFEFDSEVLVEKFLPDCREFNVAVIGDSDGAEVSEVDEPMKISEVLSFADKYQNDSNDGKQVAGKLGGVKFGSENSKNGENACGCKKLCDANGMAAQKRNFPAEISLELKKRLQKTAKFIFENLGFFGIVRIDFLFDEASDKIYVCEVNAIPGSLAFYFFSENSITTNDLVSKLIKISKNMKAKQLEFREDFATDLLG